MINTALLNDKFTTAKLPEICAPRKELLKLFRKNSNKRIILVTAPAGFGKTVSTLLWLKDSGRKSVWIGLDAYDNMPGVFYKLICTGLLSIQPQNKAMAGILQNQLFSDAPVEHTIELLSEFTPDSTPCALVLDDMHLVTNEEINKSLPYIVKRLPPNFALFVLTRNEKFDGLDFYWEEDKAAQITAKELSFSEDEILSFLGDNKVTISEEEAKMTKVVTNGWPIGINAFVQSGQLALSNKDSYLTLEEYIKNQIWNKWDESLRDFMLKTSVPDELAAPLCQALTGREDSQAVLLGLCKTNAFITQVSDQTYRYHNLFLDFLRSMAEEHKMDMQGLYLQTAKYYIGIGDFLTARRYAVKSRDMDIVTQTALDFSRYTVLTISEYLNYTKALMDDALPEQICEKYPVLYTWHVYVNYISGNAKETEYYLDKIYEAMPTIKRDFPQFLETIALLMAVDHRIPLPELGVHIKPLLPKMYENMKQPTISYTIHLPFFHRSSHDHSFLTDESVFKNEWTELTRMLRQAPQIELIRPCYAAGIALEKNRCADALEFALQGKANVDKMEGPFTFENVFAMLLQVAAVYHAMGNKALFHETLNKTGDYIKDNKALYLRNNFLAYKAKCQLMDGDKTAAQEWLDNYFVTETDHIEFYKIFQHFTTVRAYMATAQTEKAMRYLQMIKRFATDFIRPLDIAEAGVLQAVLEWAVGKKQEAQDTLEAVLINMQSYGFIRIIADEGGAILPVLKKISAKVDRETYNGSLSHLYVHEVTVAAYHQSKRYKGLAVYLNIKPLKLSNQQRHVLTLLAKGYKYTEIMEQTGLTMNTVKSHVSAAYAKLDVNNSLDATVKARELGIIE